MQIVQGYRLSDVLLFVWILVLVVLDYVVT